MAQAQQQRRYLIHNVTRKPVPQGRDTRTTKERVGHAVGFRDSQDKSRIVVAGGRPLLVDDVTPGMLALASPDPTTHEVHIRIEPIDDVMDALKRHTLPATRPTRQKLEAAPVGAAQGSVVESAVIEDVAPPTTRRASLDGARAVEMGQDGHAQRGGTEHEGAVNPSGDPNFLVRAPSGPQHGRGRATKKPEDAPTPEG